MSRWVVCDSWYTDWLVSHTVLPVCRPNMLLRNALAFFVLLLRKYRTRFINKITMIKGISCYGHSGHKLWSYQTEDFSQVVSAKFFFKVWVTKCLSRARSSHCRSFHTERTWKFLNQKKNKINQRKCRFWDRGYIWLFIYICFISCVCILLTGSILSVRWQSK